MKRREFLKVGGMGTTAFATSFYIPSVFQERRIRIGLIGAGWYGMVIAKAALKAGGVEFIAVCDVDAEHLKNSVDELEKLQGTRPKSFKNYQDLLDMKELEVVFIGTIPHWHALQFIAACSKGLDIYCEKPLAYDIREVWPWPVQQTGPAILCRSDFNAARVRHFRRQRNSLMAERSEPYTR